MWDGDTELSRSSPALVGQRKNDEISVSRLISRLSTLFQRGEGLNRDAAHVCEATPRNGELWFDDRGSLAEDTVQGDAVKAAHAPSPSPACCR